MSNPGPASVSTVNTQSPYSTGVTVQTIAVNIGTPAAVAQGTTAEQSFGLNGTVTTAATGIKKGDVIVAISKPTTQAGLAIVGWRVDASTDDKFYITYANVPNAGGNITPTASEVYLITVLRFSQSVSATPQTTSTLPTTVQ
jgi:hypothetical protein